MLQTLNMIQMNGDLPKTQVLGIIPKRVADDTTFELSDEVINATSTMEKTVIEHLKSLEITPKIKKDDITITHISQVSYKREIINDPKI